MSLSDIEEFPHLNIFRPQVMFFMFFQELSDDAYLKIWMRLTFSFRNS
jgi:hypothetical protein